MLFFSLPNSIIIDKITFNFLNSANKARTNEKQHLMNHFSIYIFTFFYVERLHDVHKMCLYVCVLPAQNVSCLTILNSILLLPTSTTTNQQTSKPNKTNKNQNNHNPTMYKMQPI